jgi:DNA-binding transcriptional MerR regulator
MPIIAIKIVLIIKNSPVENALLCYSKPWTILYGQVLILKIMLIGELSKKTGLSRDTIRFYEKNGLLPIERHSRRSNNYKEYSEAVCERLLFISKVKNFGFTLREAAEFIYVLESTTPTCGNILTIVDAKVADIESKISELQNFRKMLIEKVDECRDECPTTENCTSF